MKIDPIRELHTEYGSHPEPLDEVELWLSRRAKLTSVQRQLLSPEANGVLTYLLDASSTLVSPFKKVFKAIAKVCANIELIRTGQAVRVEVRIKF